MTNIQIAALESFLAHHNFEYTGYQTEKGVVIYTFNLDNWKMQIGFGDVCYYYLNNEVTKTSTYKQFTRIGELLSVYEQVWEVAEAASLGT